MSAATDAPTGAVGDDVTQTAGGGEPIPATDAAASGVAPSPGDSGSQDYLGRIRAGGDFAAGEVTKHQSRADKMEAEVRRLTDATGGDSGPIGSLVAQGVAPETIKQVFENYVALRTSPQTQEMILGFEQTGALPTRQNPAASSDDDDEYLTEEQKEIRELRAKVNRLEGTQTDLTQSTGTAALQGHLERFATENYLQPGEFDTIKTAMAGQIKQWGTNEQGRRLLRSLQNPSSYETVETVAWKFVPKEVRFQLGDRKRLHDRQKVERFSTDVPTDTSTTGKELPAEVTGSLNALRYSRANPDKI